VPRKVIKVKRKVGDLTAYETSASLTQQTEIPSFLQKSGDED
jgi:hypothetical protein